jgi:hypothetical protein
LKLEKEFDLIIKKYLDERLEGGENLRVEYFNKEIKNGEQFLRTYEFKQKIMDTINKYNYLHLFY